MKNKKHTLERCLPKSIRLSVYREALRIMKTKPEGELYGMDGRGLCLLLPCILWDLKDYCDAMPNGIDWEFGDTPIAFPELTRERISYIQEGYREKDRNELRIEVLKLMIKEINL